MPATQAAYLIARRGDVVRQILRGALDAMTQPDRRNVCFRRNSPARHRHRIGVVQQRRIRGHIVDIVRHVDQVPALSSAL